MGFRQMGHLVKMANVFYSNGTSCVYYVPTSYHPFTIIQPTYLLTNPPTYLDVIPTYQTTHLQPTYLCILESYNDVLK
jgi:hypothetical protein